MRLRRPRAIGTQRIDGGRRPRFKRVYFHTVACTHDHHSTHHWPSTRALCHCPSRPHPSLTPWKPHACPHTYTSNPAIMSLTVGALGTTWRAASASADARADASLSALA